MSSTSEQQDVVNGESSSREEGGFFDLGSSQIQLRRKLRHAFDNSARVLIAVGGISVIVAILLIFFYLFYEVAPLFRAAEIDEMASYELAEADASAPLHLAIEEQTENAMRLTRSGVAHFFELHSGAELAQIPVALPPGTTVSSFSLASEESGIFGLGLDNGQVVVAQYGYATSFVGPDNRRVLTPQLEYPFGEQAFDLIADTAVQTLALSEDDDTLLIVAADQASNLNIVEVSQQSSLFAAFDADSGGNFETERFELDLRAPGLRQILIDGDQLWLYAVSRNGQLSMLDLQAASRGQADDFSSVVNLAQGSAEITQVKLLLGGISLLVANDQGGVSQWFPVRDDEGSVSLQPIRGFDPLPAAVVELSAEQRRKNFVAADAEGNVGIYNSTATRQVLAEKLLSSAIRQIAISPRGDALLVESADGRFAVWEVDNEHPEVSWSAIWDQVWYEGYSEPDYIWQSSASANDFEPKYSLVPLSFGTLKAAFYAMLLAAPLAICGAIFTGYFMAPAMRRKVKPLIELMEALPTVVLGFLAGLWLAPFVERNLLGIFSILVVLPLSILLASFVWSRLPQQFRHRIPAGWEAAILIPVLLLFGYLSFAVAPFLETLFFNGDLRFYISNDLGVTYDQRNALVVGFAMGFAVIPTIFSIAEDAIFTVPKQLTYGSLALGATPWQSLHRVVLPTASPGIFSALMIGMGRAVGETMIVLMATGNTPIMDVNIFEGMRTLAANIAVEIPESEVDSTHYRILFLAAFVLFMFTFIVNTVAEVVRQRLRSKYSTI
jgi:phosphate transport system permease protein